MSATENHIEDRLSILVCIDGTEESFRGLHYAVRFSADHNDTDITLLYVRPMDRGTAADSLNMARENMLDWGLELPGTRSLKQAKDLLLEMGVLGENWSEDSIRKKGRGDRLGDFLIEYISPSGKHISLLLRVSSSVLNGILDEAQDHSYDLVIVSGSEDADGSHAGHIDLRTAISVATEHDGTVIVAHHLEEGLGHLVCVSSPDNAEHLARKAAMFAERFKCPIHLYAVVEQSEDTSVSLKALEAAENVLEDVGYAASSAESETGDPVELIVEKGKAHSLIVLKASEKSTLNRWFMGSVSHEVLKNARNSVMIIR